MNILFRNFVVMERIHFHISDRDRYFVRRVSEEHIDENSLVDTIRQVIESPAPQWFMSYDYAYFSLSRLKRGKPIRACHIRKEMIYDLCKTVDKQAERRNLRWEEVLLDVLCSPAPRLYITLSSARILFYKLINKKKWLPLIQLHSVGLYISYS